MSGSDREVMQQQALVLGLGLQIAPSVLAREAMDQTLGNTITSIMATNLRATPAAMGSAKLLDRISLQDPMPPIQRTFLTLT